MGDHEQRQRIGKAFLKAFTTAGMLAIVVVLVVIMRGDVMHASGQRLILTIFGVVGAVDILLTAALSFDASRQARTVGKQAAHAQAARVEASDEPW